MTDTPAAPATDQATRPYSPGLEGVIAGETSLSFIDGAEGRLLYRGYRIGDLVEHGSYPAIAELYRRHVRVRAAQGTRPLESVIPSVG